MIDLEAIEARLEGVTAGPWVMEVAENKSVVPESTYAQKVFSVVTAWVHGQLRSRIQIAYLNSSVSFEKKHWVSMAPMP